MFGSHPSQNRGRVGLRIPFYLRFPKQKCDARRPCSTCVDAKKPEECVYDGPPSAGAYHPKTRMILPTTADPLSRVHGSDGGLDLPSGFDAETETLVMDEEDLSSQPSTSFAPPVPSGSTPGFPSTSFDFSPPSFEELPLTVTTHFGAFQPPGATPIASPSDLVLFTPKPDSYEDLCVRSFVSSIFFQKSGVPPFPHVPLSFLGEPNLQISHTTPELEMAL